MGNITKPVLLARRGKYPHQQFKPIATAAWNEFFELAQTDCDLAHWLIEADSATVRLSARNTSVDESSLDWGGIPPIVMLVDGIIDAFNKLPHSDYRKLRADFQNWVATGILASFRSAGIAKKFRRFSLKQSSFGIVASATDEGLRRDDLKVIWANSSRFTPTKIATRQRAAERSPKRPAVKKRIIKKTR